MGNYNLLKSQIVNDIRTNTNEEITGDLLQERLLDMVESLGAGYQYMGVATPTNPGTDQSPDYNCFYIASTPGTYGHLGSLTVADGEVAILKYNGSWSKEVTGAATAAQVTQLGQKVSLLETVNTNLFNPEDPDVLIGYYLNGNELSQNAGYNTSGYIPVKPSTTYYCASNTASDYTGGFRFINYYDGSKSLLSTESNKKTFTTPANCAFVRISFYASSYDKAQVATSSTAYVPYSPETLYTGNHNSANSIVVKSQLDAVINDVANLNEDVSALSEKNDLLAIRRINLFNPADPDVLIGYYLNGNELQQNDTYNTSGYVPVKAETTYYTATDAPSDFTGAIRFVNYYNSSKVLLSTHTSNTRDFTTPANCAFVRVTFYASGYAKAQVSELSTKYVSYSDKSLSLVGAMGIFDDSLATKSYVDAKPTNNILTGKKWCVLGDSFSIAGYAADDGFPESEYKYQDGPYAGQQIVYPFIIGLRNGLNVVNLAAGGMTMCDIDGTRANSVTHGTNPVYQRIPADADYITIKIGINDQNYSSPLGTIDDEVVTTFYGAWNVVMKWILDNRPFAHVGIIVTNGSSATYTDATIAIAEKWGVAYLDEVNDPKVPLLLRAARPGVIQYVKDKKIAEFAISPTATEQHPNVNWHPNVKAHYFESTFVEDFLRRL